MNIRQILYNFYSFQEIMFSVQGLCQKKITVGQMSPVEQNIDFLKSYLITAVTVNNIYLNFIPVQDGEKDQINSRKG